MSGGASSEIVRVEAPGPKDGDFELKLQSKDGGSIVILKSVGEQSKFISNVAEEFEAGEENLVPLPNITTETLEHVVDYLNFHRDDPAVKIERPLKKDLYEIISDWDREFLERFELQGLFDIVLGANYLDIKPLLRLGCAQIYSKYIRGQSPEKIRETFGLPDDLTKEDQDRIREENRWCEEA